jgi:hypothetical protein
MAPNPTRSAAKKLAGEYFQRFPKDRYQTEVESWRNLQSQNIEFTMKRLRGADRGRQLMVSPRGLRARTKRPAAQSRADLDNRAVFPRSSAIFS